MKVKDILKLLKDGGWYESRQKGSHKQFKYNTKSGLVTVSCHRLSDEIAPDTFLTMRKILE